MKNFKINGIAIYINFNVYCNKKKEDTTSTDDRQVLKFAAFESGYGADMETDH